VYRTLGCTGIARVDLLINSKTSEVLFNEVNPLPGSLYAHNWRAKGISGHQLVTDLIRLAEERHAARARLQTTFSTNFLKQF
jgi:D-alanine-D-alanine ligase